MMALTLLILLTGAIALLAAPDGEAASPPGPMPTVVVRPGDTLWSLATRYVPDRDAFGAIEEIRHLNGLNGYTIQVGQSLILPAHG
jgi:LysM repeat protein